MPPAKVARRNSPASIAGDDADAPRCRNTRRARPVERGQLNTAGTDGDDHRLPRFSRQRCGSRAKDAADRRDRRKLQLCRRGERFNLFLVFSLQRDEQHLLRFFGADLAGVVE
jgi:hypothetical protein